MLISASFLKIEENKKEKILDLVNAGPDFLHVDVMDGKFVFNKTESLEELKKVLPISVSLDVHLMVEDVLSYIEEYALLRPKFITIHIETENVLKAIDIMKERNIGVGISINPNTSISRLLPYLSFVDLVLVMSVEPGKGGQKFISSTVNKINELKRLRDIHGYHYLIEVDGGIDDFTAKECENADILVCGSYITERMDYKKQIDKLREIVKK